MLKSSLAKYTTPNPYPPSQPRPFAPLGNRMLFFDGLKPGDGVWVCTRFGERWGRVIAKYDDFAVLEGVNRRCFTVSRCQAPKFFKTNFSN